ncbi:MAG TPA: nitrous oxide reductase accessory protein NosL [Thermodesulfovibrionales bacterium]|nr:nitrous oxide reductase accessory protein NosL [Thermodesulfovibrionales bacterium]
MCRLIVSFFLLAFLVFPGSPAAQPFPVPQGTMCSECGMTVNPDSKFSVELVTTNGKKMFFCDIGDMLRHFRSDRETLKTIYVKDYISGGWIDGEKALYVLNKRFSTPMSWNIAAFSSESEAKKWGSPVGFSGAFGLVK